MFRLRGPSVRIFIRKEALESIFDECDRFDIDETGGKLIGTYTKKGARYEVEVTGVIGPGPNAQRSPTSLFQDGEYQEKVFRLIEKTDSSIEHIGTWHTHHVNGLRTLSSGDKATYQRIVNHPNQNTDFFYALLVVKKNKNGDQRYEIKHYFLYRNDNEIYEIPQEQVRIVERPAVWPTKVSELPASKSSSHERPINADGNAERSKDQEFFADFFPHLKAAYSKEHGTVYWKGALELIDGAKPTVLVIEQEDDGKPVYSIVMADKKQTPFEGLKRYEHLTFTSARHAVLHVERDVNQRLYRDKKE